MGAPFDPPTEAQASGGTILLIEDNPAYARLVRELLNEAGLERFRMEWTDTLDDGLHHLQETPIDLVLLDLLLPDNVGTDTLKAALESANGAPIVVLTGIEDDDLARQALDLGALDYLCKGRLDADRLKQSIQRCFNPPNSTTGAHEQPDTQPLLPEATHRLKNAAHRLNTALENLDPLAPSDTRQALGHERDACKRLAHALQEIQTLQTDDATHEPVPIDAIIDQALARLTAAGPNGGQIRTEWDTLPTLHGDPSSLTRLFELLLGHLLAQGTPTSANIRITATPHDDAWTVHLSQRNPPPDTNDPVTTFFDTAPTPDHPHGTPARVLCQTLVHAHQGHLEIEPLENATTVHLTLPAAYATTPRQETDETPQGESTKSL